MIQFENVTKLYGTVIGVNDMTLTLDGGAYGLLGPNGSGKTTLIHLITGQLNPTIGRVEVFGTDPWKDDSVLREIGLCPAVDVLLPNVSAYDWVKFLVQIQGFDAADAGRRAEASLELVGMGEAMHRMIGTYSLGMRQRSKLAQALAHEPQLLILDEPFNGLDPVGRHEMTQLLLDWVRQKKSLLLASHILHEVDAVNPSFLLISGGRLLASGSPDEVRSLLSDLPSDIQIRTSDPVRLMHLIIDSIPIDSIRLLESSDSISVSTQHPMTLYQKLPNWITEHPIEVHEVRSADESLQQLFTTLIKMHRGEI